MKKLVLSFVVSFLSAISVYSQNTSVATLTHGTDNTMFYGAYALQAAHEAAVSGDVINLSGGVFNAVEITKSVILRGAGIDAEDPTYIINELDINIPEEDTNRFSMEGIRCTSNVYIYDTFCNPQFLKCQFQSSFYLYSFDSPVTRKSSFVNCKTNYIYIDGKDDAQFINCYLGGLVNYNDTEAFATCINCIIYSGTTSSSAFINCIIYSSDYASSISAFTNCVCVGNSSFFSNAQVSKNCTTSKYAEVFKDFKGTYTDDQTFELTETAKTTLLGTDGKQVGLYGGKVPYNSTPSYPQITKMIVSDEASADGKISVEIEVNAAK